MSSTLALVEPRYCHIPDAAWTDGDEVAGLCDDAGFGPDGEQRMCLDGIFAKDERGKSAAFAAALIACRQNLKTGIEKQAALGWLFLYHCDPIIWTAHEWDTVTSAFRDLDELIGGYSYLSRQIRSVNRAQRDMEFVTRRGGRMLFKTRTPGGGRGLAGEKVILDEGWKLRDSHMGSLLPTMSSRSVSGDPQVIYGSSAAHADSEVLHPLVARGRAAASDPAAARRERRLMYVEWCAPPPEDACDRGARCDHALDTPGCGCDKPEMIRQANPAVGKRISVDFILTSERRQMPPHEFGRERLGWHDEPAGRQQVISKAAWLLLADEGSEPVPPVAFACVFSSDRSHAAVGIAGARADGLLHVEVAEYRQGTSWAAPWLTDRWARHRPCAVVVDAAGHEGSIIADLEDAGVTVTSPSPRDVAQAYGQFYDAATDAQSLRHRNQKELNDALAGAVTRDIGDAGKAWGRRASGADIAPLVAVTSALWGFLKSGPAGGYDAGRSVHFDVTELARLVKMGVYGPDDIRRVWSRGLLDEAALAALEAEGIPVPAGLR